MNARWLRRAMSCWPPFLGAGICVVRIAPDFSEADVVGEDGVVVARVRKTLYVRRKRPADADSAAAAARVPQSAD